MSDESRTTGALLGLATSDRWSYATMVALCVADAAATGHDLDAGGGLQLLTRNLASLQREHLGAVFASRDVFLAATAIVALAYLHDSAEDRAAAIRSTVAAVNPRAMVDDELLRWGETVADTARTGVVPSWASGAIVDAVGSADEFALGAVPGLPAAYGALFGARYGQGALPSGLTGQLHGWPSADANDLLTIGQLLARARQPGPAQNGGPVPLESWADSASTDARGEVIPNPTPTPTTWRRSRIVLTTTDAETR